MPAIDPHAPAIELYATCDLFGYFFEAGARRRSSSKKLKMKTTLSCLAAASVFETVANANRSPSGCRSQLPSGTPCRTEKRPSDHNRGFSRRNESPSTEYEATIIL